MTKQEQQKFISTLIRIETKLARIESKQDTLNELFILHIGDAEHVSNLQLELREAKRRISELETEMFMSGKYIVDKEGKLKEVP